MINIKKIKYKSFGNALEISNGIVKIIVTADVGPRIINYSFCGGENVFWEDTERIFYEEQSTAVYGAPWYIYGGHRLWTSPEAFPRTYYPDNAPVKYEIYENGARFIQKVQRENGYGLEISVSLSPDTADAQITHKLTNCSSENITLALWGISSMAPGGIELIPRAVSADEFTPDCHIALWPGCDISDSRVSFGRENIILKQDANAENKLKFGLKNHRGYAVYLNRGGCFVLRFDTNKDGIYPDGGMSYETFTNKYFLEMESLSEIKTVPQKGIIEHTENWSLYKLSF